MSVTQLQEIKCHNASSAILDVITVGGVGGNDYKWYNASNNQLISTNKKLKDIPAGSYYIVVSNAEGIQEQSSVFEVTQPDEIKLVITQTNLSCFEANNGSFEIEISGGTGNYKYRYRDLSGFNNWSSANGNTIKINNLKKNLYTLQVRDDNNCLALNSSGISDFKIDIVEPSLLEINTETIVNPTGFGLSNGSISVDIDGGTPPYRYKWTAASGVLITNMTNSITDLVAGNYQLEVTDTKGCNIIKDFVLTEPLKLEVEVVQLSIISCNGTNNGELKAEVKGGVVPYTYKWYKEGTSSILNTSSKLTGLGEGKYYVEIVDANSNTVKSNAYKLEEPKVLELALSSEYQFCGLGNDWSITTTVTGGTAPYTYLWNTGSNESFIRNGVSGNYTVTVVDANGCRKTDNVTLTAPSTLLIDTETIVNPTGFGLSNGSISVDIDGGTPPYRYKWTAASGVLITNMTNSITDLVAGNYQLEVTDTKGCNIIKDFVLTEPLKLEVEVVQLSIISCNGNKDGELKAEVKGGVAPYTYKWYKEGVSSMLSSTPELNELERGVYYVEIVDVNSNTVRSNSFKINQPETLELILSTEYQFCGLGNDWSITTTVTGGTAPYSYLWNTGSNKELIKEVVSGNYNVIVIDANGCRIVKNITLTPPPTLNITSEILTKPTCFKGDDGVISIDVSGGTPPYNYKWNNGKTSKDINGLEAGDYEVLITDSKGCKTSKAYVITDPEKIRLDLGDDITLCKDQTYILNGTIENGVSYSWTSSNGFTSNDFEIEVVEEGTYKVTATDNKGCVVEDEIVIKRSKKVISSNFVVSTQVFVDEYFVAVNVSDPVPEEVNWLLPTESVIKETNNGFAELKFEEEGEYEISLLTKKGDCEALKTKKIIVVKREVEIEENNNISTMIKSLIVYPNPSSGKFFVDIELKEENQVNIKILEMLSGSTINSKRMNGNDKYKVDYNLNLIPGVYFILIETKGQRIIQKIIIS